MKTPDFKNLNRLLKESSDSFEIDQAIKNLDLCLEAMDNVAPFEQAPTTPPNQPTKQPNDKNKINKENVEAKQVSNEALQAAQMTPQQLQQNMSSPQMSAQTMPATTNNVQPEQMSQAKIMAMQLKSQLQGLTVMMLAPTLIRYIIGGFVKAFVLAKNTIQLGIQRSGLPWYYIGCGLIGAAGACYAVLRKRNKKKVVQSTYQESVYLGYLDEAFSLDNLYETISEASESVENTQVAIDKGLGLMSSLGHEISQVSATSKSESAFKTFCLKIQKLGTYCLAKAKSHIISPATSV